MAAMYFVNALATPGQPTPTRYYNAECATVSVPSPGLQEAVVVCKEQQISASSNDHLQHAVYVYTKAAR